MWKDVEFKALDIVDNEWHYGFYVYVDDTNFIIEDNSMNNAYKIDKDTLCEFTGQYDSDGNKIFTDDYIRIVSTKENFTYNEVGLVLKENEILITNNTNTGDVVTFKEFQTDFGEWDDYKVTIEGNSYDNIKGEN